MTFKDHFSGHATDYARFRPRYPRDLFEALAAHSPSRSAAWDVGCGNGQASVALAEFFSEVHASDASEEQIARAASSPNVRYRIAPAESMPLPDSSVDLVFVAQALHWFNFEAFYREAGRIAKPGALIVAVAYGLAEIHPAIDALVKRFYKGAIGPYWPADRAHIETGYRDIPWPFDAVDFPSVSMRETWSLLDFVGYIGTWSAVARYRSATRVDPMPVFSSQLESVWGHPEKLRDVRWPLVIKAGRITK
jgi:SAM-dependent methyltransferase